MKNEIKKLFQDSFDGFDSPVDTKSLLSGIAAKRKKKKKRIALWIFPVGLMVLSAIVFILNGVEQTPTQSLIAKAVKPTTKEVEKVGQEQLTEKITTTIKESESLLKDKELLDEQKKAKVKKISNTEAKVTTKTVQTVSPVYESKGTESQEKSIVNQYLISDILPNTNANSLNKDRENKVEIIENVAEKIVVNNLSENNTIVQNLSLIHI